MIRLEITGEKPEEFFLNATKTLSLLLQRPPLASAEPAHGGFPLSDNEGLPRGSLSAERDAIPVAPIVAEVLPPVEEKKRGRPKKEAAPVAELPPNGDPIPDFLDRRGEVKPEVKVYTVDDIKSRTQVIIEAHTKRGNDMKVVVPYVMHLFKDFGIQKAAQLGEPRYAEFMEKSQPYLDGTAKVE